MSAKAFAAALLLAVLSAAVAKRRLQEGMRQAVESVSPEVAQGHADVAGKAAELAIAELTEHLRDGQPSLLELAEHSAEHSGNQLVPELPALPRVALTTEPFQVPFTLPFSVSRGDGPTRHGRASVQMNAPRGFGKPKAAPAKAKPVKKSAETIKREKAAADFDKLKASGAPEYMVLVRTVDAAGTPSNWYPVGGITVPRSSSEDQALALAIFNNEDDLLKGAFRSYPFLKKTDDALEYGYRLKEFEDDPVKLATKENMDKANNPIQQWFNALDNPLNDGSGWFNPLRRE